MVNYGILTSAVVTFLVTTDETLAAGGYTCGASVNRDVAKISLFRRDGTRVLPNNSIPANGNLWIYGLFLL